MGEATQDGAIRMSLVVNLVFDNDGKLIVIEDAKTGARIDDLGRWLSIQDGMMALQLRVLNLRNSNLDDNICPGCLREIPPPPEDLSWKRSKA